MKGPVLKSEPLYRDPALWPSGIRTVPIYLGPRVKPDKKKQATASDRQLCRGALAFQRSETYCKGLNSYQS